MRLPGFTAEMSLLEPTSAYRSDGVAALASRSGTLIPAIPVDPWCVHWCRPGGGNKMLCCEECTGGVWSHGRCIFE